MADTLTSNSITDADGSSGVITYPSPNDYGPGIERVAVDFVTPTTGGLGSTNSIYKLYRFKSTASLRAVQLRVVEQLDTGGSSATLLVDLGAYYSDSVTDGTNILDQGTQISANCFLAAHSFGTTADSVGSGLAKPGDYVIDGLLALDPNLLGSPLWEQAGLSADPGGMIDIVLAVHTAADAAQATPIGIVARWTV